MICRYCHDGDDMDVLRARVKTLEKVAKLGRDIIHDYLTHEEQEGIIDDLKEIDAALKNEPNPQADQSCQMEHVGHSKQVSVKGLYCFNCQEWIVNNDEAINWLFAIEAASNEFAETGDQMQDDLIEWWNAYREGCAEVFSAATGSKVTA
jgi:hypothetical protein